jgi:methionyl-tRNA synthetase
MPKPKFYLTTPIYYVNARPHIGHAYSTIVADVIARRHRLLGDDTFFLTGTDEHGQKVERSAAAAGIPPQQFADEVSATFQNLWKRMGITNDDYIRTTEERHKRGVQKLWKHLEDRGAIYLSTYTGQYSIGEEMFVEGPPGTIGPDGKPTETVTEENYFFRLSDYQLPLINLIESGELNIQPDSSRNEVLSFLRGNVSAISNSDAASNSKTVILSDGGEAAESKDPRISSDAPQLSAAGTPYIPGALKDLSISRTSFKWGIPVPGNEKHVIYVWLDALANYITAIGYGSDHPEEKAKFEKYWPADLHLVGKEITRFHCVYWPAFLLAAGIPTPKSVVANGWLLFDDSKMSKSKGNVVRTETILDAFGTLCPTLVKTTDLASHPPSPETTTVSSAPITPDLKGTGFSPSADPLTTSRALAPEGLSPAPTKAERDLFASDVLRYFLLREIPFGQDGSFSFDAMITRYNADLANGYGNLVSRTSNMIRQYFSAGNVEGRSSEDASIPPLEEEKTSFTLNDSIREATNAILQRASGTFESYDFGKLLESIWTLVALTDSFLSEQAPWKLAKLETTESSIVLRQILYTAAESIRIITALSYPVLPYATAKVWAQLGLGDIELAAKNGELKNLKWGGLKPGTKLGPLSPIFPRADKGLAQIMTDMENPTTPPIPSKLVDEKTSATASPIPTDTTDPGAPPRTSDLIEPNPGAQVGASSAPIPELTRTPPHTESPASEAFANASAASTTPDTPQIAIDDFVKIDLRVAQIIVAERIPKADKLLRLEVDLGYEKRQILSGIAEWYTPEELLGRRIVVITNLAPRKMRGLDSHGMLLAASAGENGKPILATFAEDIALGSRLR